MSTDRLLEHLLEADMQFVIVGGVAAVLHGSTLLTRDLDICIPLGSPSILRLQTALRPLNPRIRAGSDLVPLDLDDDKAGAVKNLYITTDEGRLDCLGSIQGIGGFEAVYDESVELDLEGRACRVLGLEALIRAKEATGRPHDLETVIQLKALRERGGN
jgi:predicted nucleotidyltransferase